MLRCEEDTTFDGYSMACAVDYCKVYEVARSDERDGVEKWTVVLQIWTFPTRINTRPAAPTSLRALHCQRTCLERQETALVEREPVWLSFRYLNYHKPYDGPKTRTHESKNLKHAVYEKPLHASQQWADPTSAERPCILHVDTYIRGHQTVGVDYPTKSPLVYTRTNVRK